MNEFQFLKGAYDLHVHTSPDIVPRKCSDLELAGRLITAGMKGGAIKCHYNDTAARAKLLNELYPQLNMVGGITLNNAAGGLNPDAVRCSAKIGGKMLWFPTMDALAYQTCRNPAGVDAARLLSVLNDAGRLLPAAQDILDIAAEYHLITGTGHLSPREGLVLVSEGKRHGVQIVLTHADNPANQYSLEQMKAAVKLGAIIEFCYFTVYYQRTSIETIADYIQQLGSGHIILTTDFGQPASPYSDEGLASFAAQLMLCGITSAQIDQMIRLNPEQLIS